MIQLILLILDEEYDDGVEAAQLETGEDMCNRGV